jgi:hypothetical protein
VYLNKESFIRIWALITGYDYLIPDHILLVLKKICLHRLYLRKEFIETQEMNELMVLEEVLKKIDLPS